MMNSKMYVPDPNQWVKYFQRKPADNLIVDNSTIKLTSPVESVVQRARTELERINSDTDAKPIIMTPTANKSRTKSTNSLKHKRCHKTSSVGKHKKKSSKNKVTKIKHITSKKKNTNKKRNKKSTNQSANVNPKDIFG